jgi:hypothetical protein
MKSNFYRKSRQKALKKRSLQLVNEHFEKVFNAELHKKLDFLYE